ncbi:MAG: hypothetical protein KKB91_06580 [Proteobacteria bacterium]|nr:hypothetical protein [Desulfocapsa sp.]MBU3944161.1 hypothetical protein [Pseudomonadota bacterium]MCG2743133.1 hypothetical protein [Desulfobacteraceae bacterium]MBU3984124.1 hypothetical protein [Pseudomonadota bacterium]MBU4028762.1 hypothetical protein [Pseudomonadota bacterium]
MISGMSNPAVPASAFNYRVGQRIRNRGNARTRHNNCRCHDKFSGAVLAVQRMAAIKPSLPKLHRRLPGAQSSHCDDDTMSLGGNTHGVLLLKRVAGKNEVHMIGSHILSVDHNDQ